jgi:hypothetical protein
MLLELLISLGFIVLLQLFGNLEEPLEELIDKLRVVREMDFLLNFIFDALLCEIFEVMLFEPLDEG